jgi:outer membrane receptor protein involved in Fe transport
MWTPTRRQGYWASVSRAVRIPSHVDYTVRFPFEISGSPLPVELMGSDDFQPEVLNAVEVGGRFRIGKSWALDLTAFRHRYVGLYSFSIPYSSTGFPAIIAGISGAPAIPAITSNAMDGVNRGVEGVVHYDVRPGWQVSGSYSNLFAATSFRPGFNALNSFALESYTPKHQWQIHSSWTLHRNWNVDAALYRVGSLPGGVQPAHSRADLRVGRRFGEMGEVFISGQNLLRPYERELAGEIIYTPGLVRRSIDVGFRWTF